jgi:hypothetical protein
LESEGGLNVQVVLQSVLDPVQTKTEKAFVNTVGAINQASVL